MTFSLVDVSFCDNFTLQQVDLGRYLVKVCVIFSRFLFLIFLKFFDLNSVLIGFYLTSDFLIYTRQRVISVPEKVWFGD